MSCKKYNMIALTILMIGLLVFALPTIIIDPFFHFHKPFDWQTYELKEERYQNDGIVKHFEYDAIITGSSMTQNFKTTEMNELYNVNAVKTTFAGGTLKEVNDHLCRAVESNPNIKCIVRALDATMLANNKDQINYEGCPTYLYDKNPLNDVEYVLNKDIFLNYTLNGIQYICNKSESTSFDDYASWYRERPADAEKVMNGYNRSAKVDARWEFSELYQEMLQENIEQNVIRLAEENPQIEFYYFIPPYSICWWDAKNQEGGAEFYLQAEKMAAKMIIECPNIHLFSFYDETAMVCDLSNYSDETHYGEHINSQILKWMKEDKHRITKENYEQYYSYIFDFYTNYDYDAMFGM